MTKLSDLIFLSREWVGSRLTSSLSNSFWKFAEEEVNGYRNNLKAPRWKRIENIWIGLIGEYLVFRYCQEKDIKAHYEFPWDREKYGDDIHIVQKSTDVKTTRKASGLDHIDHRIFLSRNKPSTEEFVLQCILDMNSLSFVICSIVPSAGLRARNNSEGKLENKSYACAISEGTPFEEWINSP